MKVAIKCESPLLQKSLELFLEKYLTPYKSCDLVVSDQKIEFDKKSVYISSKGDGDLVKPFSKTELILALERALKGEVAKEAIPLDFDEQKESYVKEDGTLDFKFLEDRIAMLTQEYQQNLIKTIRAFYEK
jgi:hypothetical protein